MISQTDFTCYLCAPKTKGKSYERFVNYRFMPRNGILT